MLTTARDPIYGNPRHVFGATPPQAPSLDLLDALACLYASNERLFADLESIRLRVESARRYLLELGSNQALGLARLRRLREKHSGSLTVLRANRLRARDLCGRGAATPAAG
jgi:hypothetical protein